ncbi:MAG: thiol:disulfide interchange protein DsbD [Rhodospirillaceae bacterium]|nr:MAG: thiol:disulfide interchange protein DsbD [Rhodospirillaceae bacterium]
MLAKLGRWIAASLILSVVATTPATAVLAQSFLTADQAFELHVTREAAGAVFLNWTIREGYYLYRDKILAHANGDGSDLPLETSPGIVKDDPTFGSSEIYFRLAKAVLTSTALQSVAPGATIAITYQGCQDGGICYPPVTKQLNLASLSIVDQDAPTNASTPAGQWQIPSSLTAGRSSPVVPAITLVADGTGGLVSSLLADGGAAFVLMSFVLFGLALAFTPCVFPMYPILAGVLARSGGHLSPLRGFALSSVYVLAMASAFGLLGFAAAWSGQNLQMALQSPLAIIGVSALFVALALSMFGLFELQLPSHWIAVVGGRGQGQRGSLRSTAVLGFTSALIVGPCVTAPLAGALLYIAQTGDVGLGAAALFALGVGKGIPLVIFGTVGSRALPRAGAWMDTVKRAFGFVFLAAAVWMVSRIMPGTYGLALWAMLLIAAGVYLGAFDTLKAEAPGPRRLAKTAGIVASLYGVMLAVGAASGSTDLLRPLGGIVQGRSMPNQELAFVSAKNAEELSRMISEGSNRPSLVYFTADWCITCAVIKRNVLSDPTIRARLAGFRLIEADVTENSPQQQRMMQDLRVVGPPTMIFIDAGTSEVAGSRLVGDVTTESFLASAGKIRSR